MLYRALIKTHHMTSRKKITAITKAAKQYNCAVYLKTGPHPPGIMIAESDAEESVKNWVADVKVELYFKLIWQMLFRCLSLALVLCSEILLKRKSL